MAYISLEHGAIKIVSRVGVLQHKGIRDRHRFAGCKAIQAPAMSTASDSGVVLIEGVLA